jgi:hypothetical protein
MSKIRLNLGRMSIPEKISKAEQLVTSLTGNVSFPTPSPALANITSAVNDLQTAAAAVQTTRQSAKEKTSDQNEKEDTLDQLLRQLSAYVESVAGDDETLILSAGLDKRAVRALTSESPAQPQALTPTAGDHDGEIDLSWLPVPGAKSYVIERSGDPVTPTTWTHSAVVTKSNYTATGLNSGARYWFRVASINNNGQSGWSDPATKIAP